MQPPPLSDDELATIERVRIRPPLFLLLVTFALFFLRYGYDYGHSDQDEVLPFLFHRLDPGTFTQDWLVHTQAAEFSVRTYFVWMIEAIATFFPPWLAVLMVYVAAFLLLSGAIYALAVHFTHSRIAAALSLVLVLVGTRLWTLGGNDLAHSMLTASMLAWAIGLWAVYFFFHARFLITPVLLGIACWIQALVGLQLALLLILIRILSLLFDGQRRLHAFGGIVLFTALFVLWSSPALGPLVYQQLTSAPTDTAGAPSLFYVMARFRLPHHYLFFSFSRWSMIRFGALAVLGVALLSMPSFRRHLHHREFLARSLAIIGVLCLFSFVFTEVVPVLIVAKMQLFKMTVFAKLILIIVISGAVVGRLPEAVTRPFQWFFDHARVSLAGATLLCAGVLTLALATDGYAHRRIRPFVHRETPMYAMEQWVMHHTAHSAVFAVPPSFSGFRTRAQRTIIIDFKAHPYQDQLLLTWFERLTDVAPITLPDRAGPDIQQKLDAAFERHTAASLVRLCDRYHFDYVVRSTPLIDPQHAFEEVYHNAVWRVYRLEGDADAPVPGAPEGTSQAPDSTAT